MTTFKSFFKFEFKTLTGSKKAILLLLILFLALYLVQTGINQYKKSLESKAEFQEVERLKVEIYANLTYYGSVGFRILFIPGPSMVFFMNSSAISELISHIDCGDVLSINESVLGSNLFANKPGGFKDFSGIILLFGSALAMLLGFDSLKSIEYLRFLCTLSHVKKVFLSIILSRMLIISLFFVFITGCSLALVLLNNISLQTAHYLHLLYFLLKMLAVINFFFILATVLGTFKSKAAGIITGAVLWFFLVYFIPGAIATIVAKKAENQPSNYQVELKRLDLLTDFEKRAEKKEGKFDYSKRTTRPVKELIESYWNNEFKKMKELEEKRAKAMRGYVDYYYKLAVLFPTSFYTAASNELSSRGYENVLAFYRYVHQLKNQFVRFYLNKKYYEDNDKVENFVKSDENLYYGKACLPGYFVLGFVLTLFYTVVLCFVSYFLFKRRIFEMPFKEPAKEKTPVLKLYKNQSRVLSLEGEHYNNVLYNLFSGENRELAAKGGYAGKIFIDDTDVVTKPPEGNMLYLCHPEHIPGEIKTRDFIELLSGLMRLNAMERGGMEKLLNERIDIKNVLGKRLCRLTDVEKIEILKIFSQIRMRPIYLINNILKDMPLEAYASLKDLMKVLSDVGSLVVYLSRGMIVIPRSKKGDTDYTESPHLIEVLESLGSNTDEDEEDEG